MENSPWLKAVFENAIDGIIIINTKGIIVKANPAVSQLFKYPIDEVIGQKINILMAEPHHSNHDEYISNYRSTGIKKIIGIGREVEGKRKDGEIFPFFLSVSELEFGGEQAFLGIIHDISTLRDKEEAFDIQESQMEAVFQSAVEGIVIINEKGIIERVNNATINLFGYEESELLGQNVKILMPEPDRSQHNTYMNNYLTTKKPKIIGIGREVSGRKKNGVLFPLNLSVSEIKISNKIRFAGIIHDLSERKEAENEIKKLNAQLEEKVMVRTEELSSVVSKLLKSNKDLEKEVSHRIEVENALRKSEAEVREALMKEKELSDLKSRFVSMASHEFRTPLSTIRSSAEIIKLYIKNEQQFNREKHISRIKSAVNNLTSILDDFLSLSKLEENKIDLNLSEFSLTALCHEIRDEMKPLLKKDQVIVFQSQNEVDTLFSDKRLIKNIMYNLISNAIKYSGEGKEITCSKTLDDGMVVLKIIDQGIGIPKNDQVHMFGRFFRATNATNIQGTGLGLNIVKSYLDLLEGEINFESIEGKGTVFIIKLPLRLNES